jgi:hypothetical protein
VTARVKTGKAGCSGDTSDVRKIAWLPTPVRLTPHGGPMVLGVVKDTPLSTALHRAWQAVAAERGSTTPEEAGDRGR